MASNHRFAFASFFASSRQEVFIWRSIKIKTNLSGGEKTRLKVKRKLGRVLCGHRSGLRSPVVSCLHAIHRLSFLYVARLICI